jgi:hypothetical protein
MQAWPIFMYNCQLQPLASPHFGAFGSGRFDEYVHMCDNKDDRRPANGSIPTPCARFNFMTLSE